MMDIDSIGPEIQFDYSYLKIGFDPQEQLKNANENYWFILVWLTIKVIIDEKSAICYEMEV